MEALGDRNISWLSLALLSACAVALGPALMGTNWFYNPVAMVWLLVAFLCGMGCLFTLESSWPKARKLAWVILVGGLLLSWCYLFFSRPGAFSEAEWVQFGSRKHQRTSPLREAGLLMRHQRNVLLWQLAWNLQEARDLADTPAQKARIQAEIDGIKAHTPPTHRKIIRLGQSLAAIRDLSTDPEVRFVLEGQIRIIESALRADRYQIALLAWLPFLVLALLPYRAPQIVGFPLALGMFVMLGLWVLGNSREPFIDVWVFQQHSAEALLHGHNPYAITFPNIYGDGIDVYGAGLQKDGRVLFGFPYTPLSLLMAVPGYVLGGDHRYSQLFALALAAALIAYARPGIVPKAAGLLLLLSPRSFQVLEMAWTEPFVICLLALTVFCAMRFPRLTPYALGLFLCSKQYLVLAVPLVFLLPTGRSVGFWVRAVVTGAVVSLPLVLWDLPSFWHSAVVLQLYQPLRKDALSFLIWFYHNVSQRAAIRLGLIAFVAVIPVMVVALRRLPRTAGGFAGAVGLVFLTFYAFNRQAFCNYYYFVIGALCCAIAVMTPASPREAARPGGPSR